MELMKMGSGEERKSAKGKKYENIILTVGKPDAISRRYCYHYPHKLDIRSNAQKDIL